MSRSPMPVASPAATGAGIASLWLHAVLSLGGFLYAFIGTRPFAEATVAERVEGNPLDRIVMLGLFLAAVIALATNRRATLAMLRRNAGLFCVVGFSLASLAWSDHPDLTLRRAALLAVSTTIAAAIAVGLGDLRRFHTLFFAGLTAVILVNLLGVVLVPALAVTDIGVRGLYSQKNVAGIVAMIAVAVGTTWLLGVERWRSAALGVVALVPAVAFLILTRSKTSIALAGFAVGVVGIVALAERLGARFLLFVLFLALVGVVALLGLFVASDFDPTRVLALTIGDASFTGRDELWAFAANAVLDRPWLGHGYGAFWDVGAGDDPLLRLEPGTWLADVESGTINQAHNGYLELALHVGIPMTLLAVVVVARGVVAAGRRAVNGPAPRATRAALGALALLLLLHLLHNATEATLFMRGLVFCNVALLALLVTSRADEFLARRRDNPSAGSRPGSRAVEGTSR